MAKKLDWHIWKANGDFFILPTTGKPHDHINPKTPAEVQGTLYGVTESVADTVMAVLSNRKCRTCKGEGIVDEGEGHESPCPQCNGTGRGY